MTKKSRPKVLVGTRRGWATTAWTLEDIYHLAAEREIEITREQAKAFLDEVECGLEEVIINAGWNYLESAFKEKGLVQNAQTGH